MNNVKRILITQGQLKYYAGSEIIVLELTEYFSSLGINVTILTNFIEDPIKSEFENIKNLKVITSNDSDASNINIKDYDVIWVHHQLLNQTIVDQLISKTIKKRPFIVFHHMSSWVPEEFPVMHDIEQELADMVLYNSKETQVKINERGFVFSNEMVFGNPAPESFLGKGINNNSLKRVAVVSNHPPGEVLEAVKILKEKGIDAHVIGRQKEAKAQRVTSELLGSFDAIITIGKTVQYSILSSKPVYCYDWFGGSGYLALENYDKNKIHNFSGRGFAKKSAKTIVNELTENYQEALVESQKIHVKYAQGLLLSTAIDRAIAKLPKSKKAKQLTLIQQQSYYSFLEMVSDLGNLKKVQSELNEKISQRDHAVQGLRSLNDTLKANNSQLMIDLENAQQSLIKKILRKIRAKHNPR